MKCIVGGEQSGDFLYFSAAPELPRTRVRQGERTDLPNLLSSESHHQQSASQERLTKDGSRSNSIWSEVRVKDIESGHTALTHYTVVG